VCRVPGWVGCGGLGRRIEVLSCPHSLIGEGKKRPGGFSLDKTRLPSARAAINGEPSPRLCKPSRRGGGRKGRPWSESLRVVVHPQSRQERPCHLANWCDPGHPNRLGLEKTAGSLQRQMEIRKGVWGSERGETQGPRKSSLMKSKLPRKRGSSLLELSAT